MECLLSGFLGILAAPRTGGCYRMECLLSGCGKGAEAPGKDLTEDKYYEKPGCCIVLCNIYLQKTDVLREEKASKARKKPSVELADRGL